MTIIDWERINKLAGGRRVIFAAITGSYSLGLDDYNSDIDVKVCVLPYSVEEDYFHKHIKEDRFDYNFFDIRWIIENIYLPSFVHIWFSPFFYKRESIPEINWILRNREEIFKADISSLFNSYLEQYYKLLGLAVFNEKSTAEDYKCIYAAYLQLSIMEIFHKNNYNNFADSLNYYNGQLNRDMLMKLKNNQFSLDEGLKIIQTKYTELMSLHDSFHNNSINKNILKKLDDIKSSFDNLKTDNWNMPI